MEGGGRGAGRRPTLSSSSGSSWASFEEKAKDYELKAGLLGPSRNPFSPTTRQLCREDMAIYGEEPASDSLALVICEQCGRVVKSQALSKHKDLYHTKMFHIPPPSHSRIHTVGQPSSGGLTNEPRRQFSTPGSPPRRGSVTSTGGGSSGIMGFSASELPRQNSSGGRGGGGGGGGGDVGGGGGGERGNGDDIGNQKYSKEYDPNRHCGVWIEEDSRNCTRSLTCKFHQLSQKSRVQGRSRSYAELLEEHRKRKKLKKHGKLSGGGSGGGGGGGGGGGQTPSLPQPSPSEPPPLTAHPLYPMTNNNSHERLSPPTLLPPPPPPPPPLHPSLSSTSSAHYDEDETTMRTKRRRREEGEEEGEGGGGRGRGRGKEGWEMEREDHSEDEEEEAEEANDRGLPYLPDYPKPLAVCSFGARSTKCGTSVFGRRGDHLRSVLASLAGRTEDYTETTLHRKHSYSALLRQRPPRKYFTHKDMFLSRDNSSTFLRPVVESITGITFSPPLKEYTSPLPPASPPPVLIPPVDRTTSTRHHPHHRPPLSVPSPPMPPPLDVLPERSNHTRDFPVLPTSHPRLNGETAESAGEVVATPQTVIENGEDRGDGGGVSNGGGGGGGSKGRDRRRKKGRGRRRRRQSGGGEGSSETADVGAITHNHVSHLPVTEAARTTVAGVTTPGERVQSGEEPLSDVWSQRSGGEKGGRGGRGSGSGDFRMIRIKQEPLDEEEHHHHTVPHPSKPNSLLLNGIVTTPPPPLTSTSSISISTPAHSRSPIQSFNVASAAGRGAQSFVINPSSGGSGSGFSSSSSSNSRGHQLVSPHLGGLLPIRSPSLQQQQQQPQPQSFTFGHSLQGLPMQMLNNSLQRHMIQHGTVCLAPPQQTSHTALGGGGVGVANDQRQQQNLVTPIIQSLGNSVATGYPQSLTNQWHHAQFLSLPRANPTGTSGRVRAPVSPIPSGVPLHEALTQHHHLPPSAVAMMTTPGSHVPPPGSGGIFGNQSSLQIHATTGKQGSLATPSGHAPHLPSQRVT